MCVSPLSQSAYPLGDGLSVMPASLSGIIQMHDIIGTITLYFQSPLMTGVV